MLVSIEEDYGSGKPFRAFYELAFLDEFDCTSAGIVGYFSKPPRNPRLLEIQGKTISPPVPVVAAPCISSTLEGTHAIQFFFHRSIWIFCKKPDVNFLARSCKATEEVTYVVVIAGIVVGEDLRLDWRRNLPIGVSHLANNVA